MRLVQFREINMMQTKKVWRKKQKLLIKVHDVSGLVTTTALNTKIG